MKYRSQRGFAALYLTLLVVAVLGGVSASGFFLISDNQRIIRNAQKSLQAYYGAEAGIEDALFRIKNGMSWSSSGSLGVLDAQVNITITDAGATKTVFAEGNDSSRIRKVEAVYQQGNIPQFFYGAQVGEGGLNMEENSRIEGVAGVAGNVYTNGPIIGDNGATITGDAIVAPGISSSSLEDVVVKGTAKADSIKKSKICGDAYYQTIDNSSLTFLNNPSSSACSLPLTLGTGFGGQPSPPSQAMPISQATIDKWKADAAAGGTLLGSCGDNGNAECVIGDKQTLLLGPKKITGNLVLTKKQTLIVTGTLYIQGSISMDSGGGATIKCDPSYNTTSCVMVNDSWAHVKNNSIFQGSGQPGSLIMLLTTLAGCDGGNQKPQCTHHNAAVDIHNNAIGVIFYAPNSMVNIHNGVTITQVTAYKLNIDNNSVVRYEQGLVNAQFTSGPGVGWELVSWKEVE